MMNDELKTTSEEGASGDRSSFSLVCANQLI
jgi:hypothetical protein